MENDTCGAKRQLSSETHEANDIAIKVATASQPENVLVTINLKTREDIYDN